MAFYSLIPVLLISLSSFATEVQTVGSSCEPGERRDLHANFAGGEHAHLGDLGMKKFCAEYPRASFCGKKILRFDKKWEFTYGQMNALGDFYESGDELFHDTASGNIDDDGLNNIFQCFDKEGRVLAEQKSHPDAAFPDCNWVYITNSRKYLYLAATNYDHFSWDAVKAYAREHRKALDWALQARQARLSNRPQLADLYLRRALFVNGVADHYLMDLFAAGHVDVPRREMRDWASSYLSGPFKGFRGDAFAILVHELDGKTFSGVEIGKRVRNARGQEWLTHSDGFLNVCTEDNEMPIAIPSEAAKVSIEDIWLAYRRGVMPSSFKALDYAPHSLEEPLNRKFSRLLLGDSDQIQKAIGDIQDHLPFVLKLITSRFDIVAQINALPVVLQNYADRIRSDLQNSPELKYVSPVSTQFLIQTLPLESSKLSQRPLPE